MITASNLLVRVPPLFSDLVKLLAGDIDCSIQTLTKYSSDGSPFFILPQAIIYPKNAADIKHVLAFAREYTMPITVRGEGTARSGGALGEGIILDMSRYFSQIRNINMIENTITVDAGVTTSDLVKKLNTWHFDIPILSAHENGGTVGALIATKSASAGGFIHGTIREWIEELSVVVDTGEEHKIADGITPSGRLLGIYQDVFPLMTQAGPLLRAAKPKLHTDPTGYNLWNTSIGPRQLIDQITGSEGTLGIITSVTFRICPHRPYSLTTCIPIYDSAYISICTELAHRHGAENVFMYDEAYMQLSERYYPSLTPYFVDAKYVLLVTHRSVDQDQLHHMVTMFRKAVPVEDHLLKTLDHKDSLLRITSTDFPILLCDTYTNKTLTPMTLGDGLIIPLTHIASFLSELEDYLGSLGKLYTITGNISSGHVSVVTLFDARSKNYHEETLFYAKNLFSLVKEYGGGISAGSGEGLIRTPFISYIYNDSIISLFKQVKTIWDPLMILNPGKKIGATTNYLAQHFKIS